MLNDSPSPNVTIRKTTPSRQRSLYASSFKIGMQFDDVIIQLGQFGKYQRIQYFLLCIPAILCVFHQLSAVFLSATPEFRYYRSIIIISYSPLDPAKEQQSEYADDTDVDVTLLCL